MIETLTVKETAELLRNAGMRITAETIQNGIEQKVFPFGDCIRNKNGESRRCYIYSALLDEWMKEREV